MINKNILEIEILKKINCSKDVAFWNYWDHEHLDIVHNGYSSSDIMYDRENYLFRVDQIKLTNIPFLKISTPIFMVQHDANTLFTYAVMLGIVSKTTITINEISESECEIIMNYKFYLNGWKKILKPILKIMIPKWNKKVWEEDYSIKLRREKILKLNFQDFKGLPLDINNRKKNINKKKLELPIPRPRNSSRDLHPLSHKFRQLKIND